MTVKIGIISTMTKSKYCFNNFVFVGGILIDQLPVDTVSTFSLLMVDIVSTYTAITHDTVSTINK